MKKLIILLLFFICQNVNAKTIVTPYLKVKEVDNNYIVNDLEKIEKETYYKQEKIERDYKYLKEPSNLYNIKTDEIIYGKYTPYQKTKLKNKNLDEDIKTIYYYQDLKKIDNLIVKNINNILITKIIIRYKDKIIYETNKINKEYHIQLMKKYSPEYLTLEITCFLNQGDLKGNFLIQNNNFIKENIEITEKGFSTINLKLINLLTKLEYDQKVRKTNNIDNKFYIKLIKKEKLYRYREKYYKYYKDDTIISKEVNKDYRITEIINRYYLYRKEIIELYDNIKLNEYLDIDKIIKNTTIPTSKLKFNYQKNCGDTILTISYADADADYADYEITTNVNFNCPKYEKSNTKKGKTKSLNREIFSILFNTFFLRKL